MKKYNLSEIMKRAWELVKEAGATISEGLKKAWKEAKEMIEKKKFEGSAKVLIEDEVLQNANDETSYFVFKLWVKGNYHRIYVNDYKRRTVGYIDLDNENAIVTDYSDRSYHKATIKKFMASYAF